MINSVSLSVLDLVNFGCFVSSRRERLHENDTNELAQNLAN